MEKLNSIIAGCMRWGTWGAGFSTVQMQDYILFCLENGVHIFDHADIYGDYTTEADFGKAFAPLKINRQQIQLITKCGIELPCAGKPGIRMKKYNTSKSYILQQVDASLKNLQTDYLDLLLLHRPDPLLQGEEVASAFTILQESGKVLRFGVSNFSILQVQYLKSFFPDLLANQIELSWQENASLFNGLLLYQEMAKMQTQAWSPLGKWAAISASDRKKIEPLAEKYQTDPATLLLVWLWHLPQQVKCILGTTKKERMLAAINGQNIQLEDDDWYTLLQIANGTNVA